MAVRDQGGTQDQLRDRLREASQHVGLLVTFIGAFVFGIRCVVVSRGDPYTAERLVIETPIEAVIGAVGFSLFGVTLVALSYLTAWAAGMRSRTYGWRSPWALLFLFVSIGAYFLSTYTVPTFLPGLTFRMMQSILYPFVIMYLAHKSIVTPKIMVVFLIAVMILVLILTIASGRFWLTPESFTFADSPYPITAYLLRESEDHLIIFEERRRIIIEKPRRSLMDRHLCYLKYRWDAARPETGARKYLPECP